jgi:hypothetical protein
MQKIMEPASWSGGGRVGAVSKKKIVKALYCNCGAGRSLEHVFACIGQREKRGVLLRIVKSFVPSQCELLMIGDA